MLAVGLEGDERLGRADALHLVDPPGDHVVQLVVAPHPHQRDEVDVARDRIDLADPVEIGEAFGHLGDLVDLGVDHDDGSDHVSQAIGPGLRGHRVKGCISRTIVRDG